MECTELKRSILTLCAAGLTVFVVSCAAPATRTERVTNNPDELLIVDCLLPGQYRQLGTKIAYVSPRRPTKTSAAACEISGGEYVSFDRADFATALKIWLPLAQEDDPQAQTYVGEIYEKGLGVIPDYLLAAQWYQKAADTGYSRAQINLGYLYEAGLGVPADLTQAMNLYRQASGIGDGDLEYVSSVEYANRELARVETVSLKLQVEDLEIQLANSVQLYNDNSRLLAVEQKSLENLRLEVEKQRQEVALQSRLPDARDTDTAATLLDISNLRSKLIVETDKRADLAEQLRLSQERTAELRKNVVSDGRELNVLKQRLAQREQVIKALESELSTSPRSEKDQTALRTAKEEAAQYYVQINQLNNVAGAKPSTANEQLADAEKREQMLTAQLDLQSDELKNLRRDQAVLETRYQGSISYLQDELNLSKSEQTRLATRLADTELSVSGNEAENLQLRAALRQKNEQIGVREAEQKRLTAKLSVLQLSERATAAEKKAAEASVKYAEAELALATFEQSRLVTKLMEAELNARQDKIDASTQLAFLEKQLATQTNIVSNQLQRLNTLEQALSEERARSNTQSSETIAQVVALGPVIEIIEPPVLSTRGPGGIPLQADGSLEIIGRVSPAQNILTLKINGTQQSLNASGVFNFQSSESVDRVELTAVDQQGERANVTLAVAKRLPQELSTQSTQRPQTESEQFQDINFGRYHAIVIGNNTYPYLGDLQTAENDARVIDRLLRKRYNFSTQLLINATHIEILQALNRARETLSTRDNLIIYYAGHGQIDSARKLGYWLPVDAEADNDDKWLSNAVITNYLDSIEAKHIMLVADSCFSGTLTKTSVPRTTREMPSSVRHEWLKVVAGTKVRTVMSSGGIKPVYDSINGAEHSLFASAFIEKLQSNSVVLEGYSLFSVLQNQVSTAAHALGVDQTPQYAPIKHAGHEAGEFLFVPVRL